MSKVDRALWNGEQKKLKNIILKNDKHQEAIQLCLDQHAMVHSSEMSLISKITFEDELWNDLDEESFRTMFKQDHGTIARNMWHASRIEDITINLLVAGDSQVFNGDNWLERINSKIRDTGNAMIEEEVEEISLSINMNELRKYRVTVGKKTREIIKNLTHADLKKRIEPSALQRVLDEGAVLDVEGANWLIDFWGKKNVAGILLMPATRHNFVHINKGMRIKEKCKRRNSRVNK